MQFLEELFASLRRAGILRSQRGVKGGYLFAREPPESRCSRSSSCSTARSAPAPSAIFAEAAAVRPSVLAKATIADVLERETREAGATMYYI